VTSAHVATLFARHCARCHSDNGQMGPPPEGYRLTSHASTLAFDERARVVPGNPAASELLRRIKGQARPRMPLDGPPWLDTADVALRSSTGSRKGRTTPWGSRRALRPARSCAGARIDKFPRPGDYVRLEGRLDAGGKAVTERLRRR
jgi:hypothetical protein